MLKRSKTCWNSTGSFLRISTAVLRAAELDLNQESGRNDFNQNFKISFLIVNKGSLAGFDGIQINVKGSARDFQARFHPVESAAYGRYVQGSYTANFKASPEWTTVRIPFASTEYSWRGRRPSGMPEIDPAQLKGMGFLIADKIFGSSFELFVDSISGYKNE